jgi:uncharacterized membrane protein
MTLSYQEKLVWGQFLPMVVLYGYYFFRVAEGRHGVAVGSLVGVLVWIAIIQVIFSILVAALAKREPRDERDRLIEYKAFKVAYLSAIFIVFFVMWLMFSVGQAEVGRQMLVSYALGVLVGVEMLRMGTILVLHRTSVSA